MKYIVIVLFCTNWALAGSGYIYVTNNADKSCPKYAKVEKEKYMDYYYLPATELIADLKLYFANTQSKYSGIINHALIKFCGEAERQEVFNFFWKVLEVKKPDKKVFEVVANYSLSKERQKEIDSKIADKHSSENLRNNLIVLKKRLR